MKGIQLYNAIRSELSKQKGDYPELGKGEFQELNKRLYESAKQHPQSSVAVDYFVTSELDSYHTRPQDQYDRAVSIIEGHNNSYWNLMDAFMSLQAEMTPEFNDTVKIELNITELFPPENYDEVTGIENVEVTVNQFIEQNASIYNPIMRAINKVIRMYFPEVKDDSSYIPMFVAQRVGDRIELVLQWSSEFAVPTPEEPVRPEEPAPPEEVPPATPREPSKEEIKILEEQLKEAEEKVKQEIEKTKGSKIDNLLKEKKELTSEIEALEKRADRYEKKKKTKLADKLWDKIEKYEDRIDEIMDDIKLIQKG